MKGARMMQIALAAALVAGTMAAAPAMAANPIVAAIRASHNTGLEGVWRLDQDGRGDWNGRDNGRNDRNGGWTGRDHDRNDRDWNGNDRGRDRDRGYANRGTRWPDVVRIERNRNEVRIEDHNGTLLERVVTKGRSRGNDVAVGSWKGNRLEIRREGRNGNWITETLTLEDRGRRMVVRTQMTGGGAARAFTRTYERMG